MPSLPEDIERLRQLISNTRHGRYGNLYDPANADWAEHFLGHLTLLEQISRKLDEKDDGDRAITRRLNEHKQCLQAAVVYLDFYQQDMMPEDREAVAVLLKRIEKLGGRVLPDRIDGSARIDWGKFDPGPGPHLYQEPKAQDSGSIHITGGDNTLDFRAPPSCTCTVIRDLGCPVHGGKTT